MARSRRADEAQQNGEAARQSASTAPRSALEEKTLVDKCRDGDDAAWAEMHAKCQDYLVQQIRYALGDRGRDSNLVEEIAARVWFGLVADDAHLLDRFQPYEGNGLEKYLAAIARFEVLRHNRSEFRRRRREQETQVMRVGGSDDQLVREMTLDVNAFLPQLTPREKEFFHYVLMGNDVHELRVSAPNAWQLKHRIRKKLLKFLDGGDGESRESKSEPS
ncbi:MAG: RNA polymerase sigma factor [Planctomycetota bacterium]